MNIIIYIICSLTLLFSAVCLHSQEKAETDKFIYNRILEQNDLKRHDIWLPNDYYDNTSHRLPIIDSLLYDPLKCYDLSEKLTGIISGFTDNSIDASIPPLLNLLKNKDYVSYRFGESLPGNYVEAKLEVEIEKHANFIASNLLHKYVSSLILAADAVDKDSFVQNTQAFNYLVRNYKLIFEYLENETKNPEIKKKKDLKKLKKFLKHAESIESSDIFSIGFSLLKALRQLNAQTIDLMDIYKDSAKTAIIETEYGKLAIGGKGDDIYKGNFSLIIDIGGNDTYVCPEMDEFDVLSHPIRCIVDFSGDDVYRGSDFAFGSGVFGINFLIDLAGNDTYSTGDYSLGFGSFGLGVLFDAAGSDIYSVNNFGLGAAAFGYGFLIDNQGSDIYKSNSFSQGFGFTKGLGVLAEFAGDDLYVSSISGNGNSDSAYFNQGSAVGLKHIASGGIGFLLDFAGDDEYKGKYLSQGASERYSLGMVFDYSGDDVYNSLENSQGFGNFAGLGFLRDYKGKDAYNADFSSMGTGTNYSFGCLSDESGKDKYSQLKPTADNCAYSISILADTTNNNTFDFEKISIDPVFETISKDYTPAITIAPTDLTRQSTENRGEVVEDYPQKGSEEDTTFTLPSDIFELFQLAADRNTLRPDRRKLAADNIAAKGHAAVLFLKTAIPLETCTENQTLEYIISQIYNRDSSAVNKLIIDSLKSGNPFTYGLFANIAGKNHIKKGVKPILKNIESKDWKKRMFSAVAAGFYKDSVLNIKLNKLMKDENRIVRACAVHSKFKQALPDSMAVLDSAIADSCYIVRKASINAVCGRVTYEAEFVKNLLSREYPDSIKSCFVRLIPRIEPNYNNAKKLRKFIPELDTSLREKIYEAIINSDSNYWQKELEYYRHYEKDSTLKELLTNFMKELKNRG